jgi:phage gp36-like protein
MPYSTLADIEKLIPEDELIMLTDDERLGQINSGRVSESIEQADAEIDAYVGGRYSAPLASTPVIVKKLSVDIAIYNLYSRSQLDDIPTIRSERYKNAIKTLEGIAKGSISIGVDPLPASPTGGLEGDTNRDADDNVFTRDELEGF